MMNHNLASYFIAGLLLLGSVVMAQSTTATNTTDTSGILLPTNSSSIPSPTSSMTMTSAISESSLAFSPQPTVQGTGWNPSGNATDQNQESWLKAHNRFVFIIVIGLVFIGLILWYIIKSVKGMRKRLKEENQAHLNMMPTAAAPQPECVTPISPPPAYKFDDHPNNQQGQRL